MVNVWGMDLLNALSLIIGVAALTLGAYNLYRQRKKDELRELSEELQELHEKMERFRDSFFSPHGNIEINSYLQDLANDVLAFHHARQEAATIVPNTPTVGLREDKRRIKNSDQLASELVNGEMIDYKLSVQEEGELGLHTSHDIDSGLWAASLAFRKLHEVDEEHRDLVEQFDPRLLNDCDKICRRIVENSASSIFEIESGLMVDPEDHDHRDEILTWIFRETFWYDGIEDDLENLSDIIDRIDELRSAVLQSSY